MRVPPVLIECGLLATPELEEPKGPDSMGEKGVRRLAGPRVLHESCLRIATLRILTVSRYAPEKKGKCNEGDAYWKHASATLPPPRWREQSENPKRRRLRLEGSF